MSKFEKSMQAKQEELESYALAKGAERFIKALDGEVDDATRQVGILSRSRQSISHTEPGRKVIGEAAMKVCSRLRELFLKGESNGDGRGADNTNAFLYAESLEGIAYLAVKTAIDSFFGNLAESETNEMPRLDLINKLGYTVILELASRRAVKEPSEEFRKLEKQNQMARAPDDKDYFARRMRQLKKRMASVDLKNDPKLKIRVGLVLYHTLLTEDIIKKRTVTEANRGPVGKTVYCSLTSNLTEELKERIERWGCDHPVWGPTVIPPRKWTNSKTGGYHYALKGALPLIKNRGHGVSKKQCPHAFEAINNLQGTSYRVNADIFEFACEVFNSQLGDDYEKLFNIPKVDDTSAVGYERNRVGKKRSISKRDSLIIGVLRILLDAERFKDEECIYFVHTMDFRGRIYPRGTYLNPQGNDLCKGLLNFASPKPIATEEAQKWLANHGAGCFGGALNRESFSGRLKWVAEHEEEIFSLAASPKSHLPFMKEADSPWAFLAWCKEWAAYKKSGYGYLSHLPVAVDGTCNGFQHFAALMRSKNLASNVNLMPADKPSDIYQFVADSAKKEVCSLHAGEKCDAISHQELLTEIRRLLFRSNFIGRHKKDPEQSDYERVSDIQDFGEIPSRNSVSADDDEPFVTIEDGIDTSDSEQSDDPDDDHLECEDGDIFSLEQQLSQIGCVPGVTLNEKQVKKARTSIQNYRARLANRLVYDLTKAINPIIKFDRKLFKTVVMTFPYSASYSGHVKGIYEELLERNLFNTTEHDTTGNYRSSKIEFILAQPITKLARQAINHHMPHAKQIMDYLRRIVPEDKGKHTITWETPCGLTVYQTCINNSEIQRSRLAFSGEVIYIRDNSKIKQEKVADMRRHRQSISPNFIHSLDAAHLMKTVNAAYAKGITHFYAIHDSYATHAADMDTVATLLREEFVRMYSGNDLLQKLNQDLDNKNIASPMDTSESAFDITAVKESEYFFS